MERGWQVEDRFVGTLLGPEGTGRPSGWALISGRAIVFLYRCVSCGSAWVWRGCVGGFWLVVENCTVDASIF